MRTHDLTELHRMVPVWQDPDGTRVPLLLKAMPEPLRKVVLEVNAENPTKLVMVPIGGKPVFLATVDGRARLTFFAPGIGAEIWADDTDGDLRWWCSEMEDFDTAQEIPHTFTVLRERRRRDPTLDRMMKLAAFNSQKREGRLLNEMRKLQERFAAGERDTAAVTKLTDEQKAEADRKAEAEKAEAEAAAAKKKADKKAEEK